MQSSRDLLQPVEINGQMVEVLDVFKYPGSGIDGDFPFKENTSHIFVAVRRAQQFWSESKHVVCKLCVRAWFTVLCLLTRFCGAVI